MNNLIENFNLYVSEKSSDYAIMLSGDWGAGKSYFVKNKWLKSINLSDFDVKMISLNGMSSVNDFLSSIGKSSIEEKVKISKNVKYTMSSIVKTFGNQYNISFSITEYNKLNGEKWLESSKESKTKILIIDDLERTKIDIEELFGLLIQYISTNELKVIIVCNEDELCTNNKERYLKIKEKLIGDTFSIVVNKEEVLKTFLRDIECDELYKKGITNVFSKIFNDEKYNNLRIIYRSLLKFKQILKSIDAIIINNTNSEEVIVRYIEDFFSIFFYLYYQKEIGLLTEDLFKYVEELYFKGEFINRVEIEKQEKEKEKEKEGDKNYFTNYIKQKFIPLRNNGFNIYKKLLFDGECNLQKYSEHVKDDLSYEHNLLKEMYNENNDSLYSLITGFLDCDLNIFIEYQQKLYTDLINKKHCSINYLVMSYVYLLLFYEKNLLHIETLKSIQDIDDLFLKVLNDVDFEAVESYLYYSKEWSIYSLGYRGYGFDYQSLTNKKKINWVISKVQKAYFRNINNKKIYNFKDILIKYNNEDTYFFDKLGGLNRFSSCEERYENIFWDIDILNQIGFNDLCLIFKNKSLKWQYLFWSYVTHNYSRNNEMDVLREELKVIKKFKGYYNKMLITEKERKSNSCFYIEGILRDIDGVLNLI